MLKVKAYITRRSVIAGAIASAPFVGRTALADTTIPLDPGNGGQSILPSALKPGDIILSTTAQPISSLIRWVTNGPVSHAAVYLEWLGKASIIEAHTPSLSISVLDDAMKQDSLMVAFRNPSMTSDLQSTLLDWFTSKQGTPYNFWGSVQNGVFQFLGQPVSVNLQTQGNSFFCSQLVISGFSSAGLPLTTDSAVWSPNDLAKLSWTDQLQYVGHLKFIP